MPGRFWPNSPAYPPTPPTGAPLAITPPPIPLAPPLRYTRSRVSRPAPKSCSAIAPRLASFAATTGNPVAASRSAATGSSVQSRCGAHLTTPSVARTRPGTARPTATTRRPAASPVTMAPIRVIASRAERTWSTGCRSRSTTTPARPTTPAVMASTSGLTAITTRPGCGHTSGDGRPTELVASGLRSITNSPLTSSATSAATVERLSPVAIVRAARETDRRRWTSSSTMARFSRRTLLRLLPRIVIMPPLCPSGTSALGHSRRRA